MKATRLIVVVMLLLGAGLAAIEANYASAGSLAIGAWWFWTSWVDFLSSFARRPASRLEIALYASAAILSAAVMTAALLGYFHNVLTYAFAASFALALGMFILKRLLRVF